MRRVKRAQILLAANNGMIDEAIARTLQVHVNTVERIRKRFVEGGLVEAIDARRILRRLEFHFTPVHASWLNMVELELAVLSGQCLKRRIDSLHTLRHEIGVWQADRNFMHATVAWRFTCEKARLNLHLCPH